MPKPFCSSNAPPEVDKPARIIDWLRLDGAQVTRPSIDPYRENINLDFYLSGILILFLFSMPFLPGLIMPRLTMFYGRKAQAVFTVQAHPLIFLRA